MVQWVFLCFGFCMRLFQRARPAAECALVEKWKLRNLDGPDTKKPHQSGAKNVMSGCPSGVRGIVISSKNGCKTTLKSGSSWYLGLSMRFCSFETYSSCVPPIPGEKKQGHSKVCNTEHHVVLISLRIEISGGAITLTKTKGICILTASRASSRLATKCSAEFSGSKQEPQRSLEPMNMVNIFHCFMSYACSLSRRTWTCFRRSLDLDPVTATFSFAFSSASPAPVE
eukprot:TRINITY_DN5301_c0_g1_i7.p1 TRINITY_DN5301_c0_g1~~TRINITY_DN5301_c0_g1_i7.p1  ORF type:complete len:227 (+),score=-13.43 TRINITY_DN5301_c0_g1_i7:93-773(+)